MEKNFGLSSSFTNSAFKGSLLPFYCHNDDGHHKIKLFSQLSSWPVVRRIFFLSITAFFVKVCKSQIHLARYRNRILSSVDANAVSSLQKVTTLFDSQSRPCVLVLVSKYFCPFSYCADTKQVLQHQALLKNVRRLPESNPGTLSHKPTQLTTTTQSFQTSMESDQQMQRSLDSLLHLF